MKDIYLAVAGRVRQELQELTQVVERTISIWQRASQSADDYYVDATALNLHGFYAGVERIFEIVADRIDRAKPTGAYWHQELLQQMTAEIPRVRPAVLSPETRDRLDKYRGFRHVVRNVYTFNLDAEQVEILVRQLQPTMDLVSQDLMAFADFLEQVGSGEQ